MQLTEKYRPKQWSEVIGQDDVLRKIDRLSRNGLKGRAYHISGQSGTGKTTIARLIADEVARPWSTIEMDGADVNAEFLRDTERSIWHKPLDSPGWCIVVNEAHGMRPQIVTSLNSLLEKGHVLKNSTWVFTTTCDGQLKIEGMEDSSAFISRCVHLELSRRGLCEAFAVRMMEVANSEGIAVTLEWCTRTLKNCRNNLRAGLQSLEVA